MRHRRVLGWLAAVILAVVSTACGRADGQGPGGPGTDGPFLPDEAVIVVEYTGGFVPLDRLATRLPIVAVYGDGRVITEGPVPAIYPGPALPNVQAQEISTVDVGRLAGLAIAAGVGRGIDLGQPPVSDAPSTRFTVLTDAVTAVTEVSALGLTDGASGLTRAQLEARRQLRELLEALTNLDQTLGAGAVSESKPYLPAAVAAVASPWTNPADPGVAPPPERAWPGPELPGEPLSTFGLSCLVVTGDQAQQVLAAAATATTITPWVSGGNRWSVSFRPLLPDETSCDDLL